MGVLYYRDGATYKPLGGGGGSEEVTIGGTKPSTQYTDLWVDTSADSPVTDWSTADNRYLLSGFRNVIRNGDMQIAQRGNGSWTANGYTVDGWSNAGAGGTRTLTRTAATVTSPNWLNCAITGQSAAGDYELIQGNIESVLTLNGQQVTLTFTAKAASGTPKIGLEIYQNHGTGGSPTSDSAVPIGTVAISTTATKYTVTFTVPSVSGRTLGTNGNDYVGIVFWLSAGSTFASRAPIGIQNNTFSISDVQLEAGSSATPFERLPVQQQLAWCQRYFQRWAPPPLKGLMGSTIGSANRMSMGLPVQMRAIPVALMPSGIAVFDGLNVGTASSIAVAYLHVDAVEFDMNLTGAVAANKGVQTYMLNTNYLDLSAEL